MDTQKTENKIFALATGRRKEATARVKVILSDKSRILINGRNLEDYFPIITHQVQVKRPLVVTEMLDKVEVKARVEGGGVTGQAGAVSLGIARALVELNPSLRAVLRKEDLLTRDPRAKERKKYGQRGARRRFQWTKR